MINTLKAIAIIPLVIVGALLVLPIVAIYVLLKAFGALLIVIAISFSWIPKGKRFLIIFSESELWSSYFQDEVLPQFGDTAQVINLSRDGGKKKPWHLAWVIHKQFTGYRNRFPIVLRFTPFFPWESVRFYNAFKEAKKGKTKDLEHAKSKLKEWYPKHA